MESGYIHIANHVFPTLFAISEEEQSCGLMEQEWPPPIMSFIYTRSSYNKFWMKNTPSPLDIVFSHNGIINQICKGEPYSLNVIGEDKLSDLIIEFPYGTMSTFGIKLGCDVGLVSPTPAQLKRIIAEKYHGIIKI